MININKQIYEDFLRVLWIQSVKVYHLGNNEGKSVLVYSVS